MSTPQPSPPKRMTRSRAKAVEEKTAAMKTTKIITPATQAAQVASRNSKRKTRLEGAAAKPSSEPQKPIPVDADVPKTNSAIKRQPAGGEFMGKDSSQAVNKPSRGRLRKTAEERPDEAAEKSTAKTHLATRTRRDTDLKNSQEVPLSTMKKRVTFREAVDEDKENLIHVASAKRPTISSAAPRAASNNREPNEKSSKKTVTRQMTAKQSKPQAKSKAAQEAKPSPLSPKKDSQVAKVIPTNVDDDELSGARTPLKQLTRSPITLTLGSVYRSPTKCLPAIVPQSPTQSPTKAMIDNSDDELQKPNAYTLSPKKTFHDTIAGSPAKRPPQSPFKDSMKFTAKRRGGNTPRTDRNESLHGAESVLAKCPIKFDLSTSKVPRDGASSQLNPQSSLLQSPARRPTSPVKFFAPGSSSRTAVNAIRKSTTNMSKPNESPMKVSESPSKQLAATSKLAISSQRGARVNDLLTEKLQQQSPQRAVQLTTLTRRETPTSCRQSRIPMRSPPRSASALGEIELEKAYNFTPTNSMGYNITSDIPPGSGPAFDAKLFGTRTPRSNLAYDDDSEDELQAPSSDSNKGTPMPKCSTQKWKADDVPGPMTALAQRFGAWEAANPEEGVLQQQSIAKACFMPSECDMKSDEVQAISCSMDMDPLPVSEFEEAMAIREDGADETNDQPEIQLQDIFGQSSISEASQDYGDENAVPIDPTLLNLPDERTITCTPARVFQEHAKIVHTVSKVPLRSAADEFDSPLPIQPVRRSKSLSGVLSPSADLEVQVLRQINPPAPGQDSASQEKPKSSDLTETPVRRAENIAVATTSTSPSRTPRPDLNGQLLRGAVVFVDVHTTEGADASGIFVELLGQMGAKCVKQWNWNLRRSISGNEVQGSCSNRVGITHVVFKDGGKRTMEKVRDAKGIVLCVGVGWVLDCERQNEWLDESFYSIDISTIPRGGSRRRKSMEPRRLSSFNGSVFDAEVSKPAMSPSKEFLDFDFPKSLCKTTTDETQGDLGHRMSSFTQRELLSGPVVSSPKTPVRVYNAEEDSSWNVSIPYLSIDGNDTSCYGSPTTPYFLHKEALVQQSCPPKQAQELLFPLSGNIEDHPDEAVRRRLVLARRKSLQWAPAVRSPLGKAFFDE